MSFRAKFCIVGAPIVLFAAVAQSFSEPAAVEYNAVPTQQVENNDAFLITRVGDKSVTVYNKTSTDIFMADLRFRYYTEDGAYDKHTEWFRVWDLRANDSVTAEVDFNTGEWSEPRYFHLEGVPRITAYTDDENGEALKDIVNRRNSGELSREECYALKGYMPTQCDEFTDPVDPPGSALQELQGFIEDGTFDYAQEFAGK
jgi:hypothetical protein